MSAQRAIKADPPPAPPEPEPQAPLFRPQVLEERQTPLLGTVLIEPKLSHRVFSSLAAGALLALFALLFLGSYTSKVKVSGWLVPSSGLIRVFAPAPGSVVSIRVREGQRVAKGEKLLTISGEVRGEESGGARQAAVDQLQLRRGSLDDEKLNQDRLFAVQAADLKLRIATLRSEQEHLSQELSLQQQRSSLAQRALDRNRQMRARDLISLPRLEQSQQEALDLAGKVQILQRQLLTQRNELSAALTSAKQLESKYRTQIGEIDRNSATLMQELADADSRREMVIVAPEDGVVSGLQSERGGSVNPATPLMTILPVNAQLEAQIYANSRVIGFVHQGQRVQLRYLAFAFQKFGSYSGTVTEVSRSAANPAELAGAPAGLLGAANANEPVYRIKVALDRNSVIAYGQSVALKAGMQLDADILVESRRLYEWMLDPLYTITGR